MGALRQAGLICINRQVAEKERESCAGIGASASPGGPTSRIGISVTKCVYGREGRLYLVEQLLRPNIIRKVGASMSDAAGPWHGRPVTGKGLVGARESIVTIPRQVQSCDEVILVFNDCKSSAKIPVRSPGTSLSRIVQQ